MCMCIYRRWRLWLIHSVSPLCLAEVLYKLQYTDVAWRTRAPCLPCLNALVSKLQHPIAPCDMLSYRIIVLCRAAASHSSNCFIKDVSWLHARCSLHAPTVLHYITAPIFWFKSDSCIPSSSTPVTQSSTQWQRGGLWRKLQLQKPPRRPWRRWRQRRHKSECQWGPKVCFSSWPLY